MGKIDAIRRKYLLLGEHLNELTRRFWAATEALALGYGGIALVAEATGISRRTIERGIAQIERENAPPPQKLRRQGGGRKSACEKQPGLLKALEALVEPLTRGDPESPLRWTCKSTRRIAEEMRKNGWRISNCLVDSLLREMEYSLQGNRKTLEGSQHPDRNAQFEHINACVTEAMAERQPVISVDTKKKELVGNYANRGEQWMKKGTARAVSGHDFPDPSVPRAFPYGIYDLALNRGFVNVGTHHDTAAFAVKSIQSWWTAVGAKEYPKADRLWITADGGGSNGSRLRLWKWELQRLSNRLGVPISVMHFPPGTSKWNKVEHRLFSFISSNWRGEPLADYETVVNLIRRTATRGGLRVKCRLDMRKYPLGRKVTDEEMASIRLIPDKFHGDWNYSILPNRSSRDTTVIS
jgi:transposase